MSSVITAVRTCFKACPMCKTEWDSMDSFLADPHLIFNGYQPNFGNLDQGIFFFTHDEEHCGTTMALKVETFASLYTGPRHPKSKRLSHDCPGYCLDKTNLKPCSAQCANAYAREIAQKIKERMAFYRGIQCHKSSAKIVPAVIKLR